MLKKTTQYPNEAHKRAFDLLVEKIATELDLKIPKNKVDFLKTLLKDYIVLTR
jgi:hypothetical protein